jgi:uncharacterized membrane protein YfcA
MIRHRYVSIWLGTIVLLVTPALCIGVEPITGAHASLPCSSCHSGGDRAAVGEARCTGGGCHAREAAALWNSRHDLDHLKGTPGLPGCADCHHGHHLVTGRDALLLAGRSGLDEPCMRCHGQAEESIPGRAPAPGIMLRASAHGVGNGSAARSQVGCYACHGFHTVSDAKDPGSPMNRTAVPAICGRCHEAEQRDFSQSIHGAAVARGSTDAPTCVSCHGSHGIRTAPDGDGPDRAWIVATCAGCHDDPGVIRRADLPPDAVETYEQSFHGVIRENGIADGASCVSCHGAHDILPASDPRSRVNPSNIRAACQDCHRTEIGAATMASMASGGEHPRGRSILKRLFRPLKIYFPIAGTALNGWLVLGLGALVGFLSGLFGVGGGFLMTPLLIFIGVPAALTHSRLGNVDFKMGLAIVAGGFAGGFAGVRLVHQLRSQGNFDFYLKLVYVLVLGFIGATMLIEGVRSMRERGGSGEPTAAKGLSRFLARLPLQMQFPKSGIRISVLVPASAGFLVGALAAFLGVGGGFIMLPTMIYVIGIPTRVAVGTDLFQIVLTSANVAMQQAITNHTVDVLLAVMLFFGSTIAAQFGARASRSLRGEQIRVLLALIVLVVMMILLRQLLVPPGHLIDFARSGGGH